MIQSLARRLPFFYGWVIVAVVFVTMAIGVNARTAFSLVFPPILDEFGWERGVTAGAFSFGFLVAAVMSPALGRLMDRRGPIAVMELGVFSMAAGLLLVTMVTQPWQLYATFGVLVGVGSICLGYSGQSLFLPNWFARKRGLAISLAFSGVGIGSIILLPWLQMLIEKVGWRVACWTLGLMVLFALAPINLLLRRAPGSLGLLPDGDAAPAPGTVKRSNIIDAEWAAIDWTLARAMRTARFWWIAVGFFCGLYAWYAVQVHQTKYLIEIGFGRTEAAWALGLVSLVGIPGQIAIGAMSDRIGREPAWCIGCAGFVLTYLALFLMRDYPTPVLLYVMVVAQGMLGYGLTPVMGAIPAEIFEGKHYGAIFGTIMLSALSGGACGPWLTGVLHDHTGNYDTAWLLGLGFSLLSGISIWMASPRKVRAVAGRMKPVEI